MNTTKRRGSAYRTISNFFGVFQKKSFSVAFAIVFLFSASQASAAVVISEIMYDPSGTDTKHEWIEVCNTGGSAVDIGQYKLNESGTNHGFTSVKGGTSLGAQGCAVLADDAPTFLTDYPSFAGILLDTSFSLSNTGEPLILRDASLADVDGISYTNTQGANGDGSSLHRSGSTFASGVASPGTEPALSANTGTQADTTTPTDTGTQTNNGTSTSVTTVFHTVTIEPPPRVFIRVPDQLSGVAQSVVFFTAETYNAKGNVASAQVSWVFGDGFSEKGSKVTHVYTRPGVYNVTVIAETTDGLNDEVSMIVTITDNNLLFSITDDGTEVSLTNGSTTVLDLTGYRIIAGSSTFYFPEKTRILAGKTLVLSTESMKLSSEIVHTHEAILMYPDTKTKQYAYAKDPHQALTKTSMISMVSNNTTLDPFVVGGFGEQQKAEVQHTQLVAQASQTATSAPVMQQSLLGAVEVSRQMATKTSVVPHEQHRADATPPESISTPSQGVPETQDISNIFLEDTSPETQVAAVSEGPYVSDPLLLGLVGLVLLCAVPLVARVFVSSETASQTVDKEAASFEIAEGQ